MGTPRKVPMITGNAHVGFLHMSASVLGVCGEVCGSFHFRGSGALLEIRGQQVLFIQQICWDMLENVELSTASEKDIAYSLCNPYIPLRCLGMHPLRKPGRLETNRNPLSTLGS